MPEEFFYSDHDKPPLDSSHCDARALALLALRYGVTQTETEAIRKEREERQRREEADAMRAIAARARDAADCRLLLEACGLLPYESAEHRDRIAVASRLDYVRP